MVNVLITSIPFADKDKTPIKLLDIAGISYVINPVGRKFKEEELVEIINDYDAVIAGTDPITARVLTKASRLKLIARMGIGLNSIDLNTARQRGILITYTPDVPVKPVAEITLGMMITLLRQIHISNAALHECQWQRSFGRCLSDITVGLIGMGPIGRTVLSLLQEFKCRRIMVNDINPNIEIDSEFQLEWCDKETIYKEADVISLHVPLSTKTYNMISIAELEMMKPDAILINTARGGLINESDLYTVMKRGHLSGAGIDVFEEEPYTGPLREIERCLLTPHVGAMSTGCRIQMELEATMEVVRYFGGETLAREVPDYEYKNQQ